MMESIEIHTTMEPIAAEWDEFARRVHASPFERPGWFSCWLDAFGSSGLEVVALRRDRELAAVIPVISRHGVVRSPTNWHTPRFGPVAEDGEARRAVFAALLGARPRSLDLSFLDTVSVAEIKEASPGTAKTERCVLKSPYIAIEQDWESYWRDLSKNLRSNVRRRRKRLAALGEVAIEVVEGGEMLSGLLDECFRLEAGGWKGDQGTAILSSPQTARFYGRVARWGAETGLLRLGLLRLDGRVIAFNLGLETARRHYLLKLGHDVSLRDASPGTVLTAGMVERAFSSGLESYEFLGGRDSYKLHWSSGCREMFRVQLFARSLFGLADRLVQTRGRAIAISLLRRGS